MSTLAMTLYGAAGLLGLNGAIFMALAASPRANEPRVERTLLVFALAALVISIGCAAAGGIA